MPSKVGNGNNQNSMERGKRWILLTLRLLQSQLSRMVLPSLLFLAGSHSFADTVLENGDYAGSIVSGPMTIGWFIDNNETLKTFNDALERELSSLDADLDGSNNLPDFAIFIIAHSISIDGALNRKHFSFLTNQQVRELEIAGLRSYNCSPLSFATQSFQVTTFVTIQLEGADASIASDQKLSECVDKVFQMIGQ